MNFSLIPLREENITLFKRDMQAAFQQGAAEAFGETDEEILPESHIDRSLAAKGAAAYEAVVDGETVGGAIVVIDRAAGRSHLDFLYVKNGVQSRGVGKRIWEALEGLYPETKVWETVTPYFEKRNIHFYINCCGFHAVEFYSKYHPDPFDDETPDNEYLDEYFDGMFRFEKQLTVGGDV